MRRYNMTFVHYLLGQTCHIDTFVGRLAYCDAVNKILNQMNRIQKELHLF